jgi:branched-chain amino acid transport system substrate-binding protein
MRKTGTDIFIVQLILCVLILFSFSPEIAASDFVLGMSAAFTGRSKRLGLELYRGSMAYFHYINQNGGINGSKILIKAYDDGYNPTPAIKNTIRLIEQDAAFLLFNYVGTPTVTRILPLLKNYDEKQIYLFFPFTGAQPQREPPYDRFVFNLRASYRQETKGLVDNLINIGRNRIGIFYQADAYGRSGWDGVRRALSAHGLQIAAEATYRRGIPYTQSLMEQVNIIKKADIDGVISIGSYAACAAFIRDARDAGLTQPIANLSFVGSESMLDLLNEISKREGKDYTKGLINSQVVPSYEQSSLPAVQEYKNLVQRYPFKSPIDGSDSNSRLFKPSFVSFEGFLNAKVLVEILFRRTGLIERKGLKETVESIRNLDIGINSPVTFNPDKHQGLDKVYYTTVKNNRFVPIESWKVWEK